MRNIAMIPGMLALLLSGILLYVVYRKPGNLQSAVSGTATGSPSAASFRIAYFNLDSLEAHYNYFKDVLDQLKSKENEMNAELSGMEKGYQKKIT